MAPAPTGAERVLTRRELNRALLARQLLLERVATPLPRALEAIGGIQAQYAPSMYVGLWSRTAGFERDVLTRLLEARAVVQATLMRITIHLVTPSDYWPFAIATREARRATWLRSRRKEVSEEDMRRAAEIALPALEQGPLRRADLEALVGKLQAAGLGLWLDLVRVPPSGTWERRRADVFGLASQWLGPAPASLSLEAAVEHLVRSYLRAFGPASKADVQSYTGLPRRALAPALEAAGLRRFRGDDGTELLDLPDGLLPGADTPAPVRFLPTYDATLLVHARRTGLLPEEHRSKIFQIRKPHSDCTFLVDGQVAGTWRYDDGKIDLSPFGKLDAAARRALAEEAERLAAFHA